MAVVLAIVALLMGGLLPMLSGQQERAQRNETRQQMEEIRQALIGFAVVNGRLPCPTDPTITDPTHADYGSERADCSAAPTEEGYLPWKTLGVSEIDAWGTKRSAAAQPWNGYWRYRVSRNFANQLSLITMTTSPFGVGSDALVVQDRNGTQITSNTENPVAIVFSTGPDLTGNGENASTDFEGAGGTYVSDTPGSLPDGSIYDDMLVWVSRPQIINRLVATGKLP
ncbi:MAG: hypothetical protein A2100_01310 [Sideroxydans sp. GWF2_59_14]|nr:MAG: hypothetical protein A2100_01310 [Sideroxydans sp. GWF2_59_14]